MRNPLQQAVIAFRTWLALRRDPGLFRFRDGLMQFQRLVLPRRWVHQSAGRALSREAVIESEADGLWRVTLPHQNGLVFFWPTEPDPSLWALIEQEVDEGNPHCYSTPPIVLTPRSVVIDVGACEGLFAFRCLRSGLAREVIAFEPSPAMAALLERGAGANQVCDRLRLVRTAVGARSGVTNFDPSAGEQTGAMASSTTGEGTISVPCVTLDDYCGREGVRLGPGDLIKVDAEGADFEVLKGAEGLLRQGRPQVAVTTYHLDEHAREISAWLRRVVPDYRLRLKGFAPWTPHPRPVLLLASVQPSEGR